MYSFPDLEPVFCPTSSSNGCFLPCIQISQESGKVVWYSHLFKNFPVCCDPHSQRLWYSHKAKVDVFLEVSHFFNDPMNVGNLISGSSAFPKSSLNIWKFTVHVLLKTEFNIYFFKDSGDINKWQIKRYQPSFPKTTTKTIGYP